MKALILDGKVVDLCEAEFEVHSSLTWVDATDDAEVGGSWDGTNFGPRDARTDAEKAADALAVLREERNHRLLQTDWWAGSDHTMTQAQTDYRQALRDITNTYSSIDDEGFAWPTKPE
jgi:hypothetical protein